MKSKIIWIIIAIWCFYLATQAANIQQQKTAYVFSYFDTRKEDAGLCIAYSYDGYHWTAINDKQPVMRPTIGKNKLLRDPSICQAPDGTFHVVWTSSWTDQIIGYASSKDLIHWSEQREIPVMKDYPTARNSWAPELFYDEPSGLYYICWASTVPGADGIKTEGCLSEDDYNHRIYCTTTRDFKTFSKTRLFYNPDFNAIDAAIVKDPLTGELLMVVKNENLYPAEKNIRVTRAKSMKEGFSTSVSAPIHGKVWCEGPSPLFVGEDLLVYYDMYGAHKFGASRSRDHGQTWEDATDQIQMPEGMSHGTAIAVPKSVVDNLQRQAHWITVNDSAANDTNTWMAFRKDVMLKKLPRKVTAQIAADSKYWLWVNGHLAVFEGGLKRGPNPSDGYYDEVDLTPFLRKGNNQIAILVWYFGKPGFSHASSGMSGLLFSAESIGLNSDASWLSTRLTAYQTAKDPLPNWRLAESNIRYVASKDIGNWQTTNPSSLEFRPSIELGLWGSAPWNNLVPRPIPQWKDYGMKDVPFVRTEFGDNVVLTARLPYNMQMTPTLELDDAVGGTTIKIETDHVHGGSQECIYAEYVTRQGQQQYESLGWMNGDEIRLIYPKTAQVNVVQLAYRETGYDAAFEGTFDCDDDFVMRFWRKAMRTLYVNMRDNYFDCPDRERAQWWGDVTILMGQSFYQLSPAANALMKKAIHELVDWQREDQTLYSPVPQGNYSDGELPAQMLASISTQGFWNYYMHTGDAETMRYVYPAMRSYLSLWELDETGLTQFRKGGWSWGDWGEQIDIRLMLAAWHYMALQSAINVAQLTNNTADISAYEQQMIQIKAAFNLCWNGTAYRHPNYQGATDDRVQALAVVAGLAEEDKYERIYSLLCTQQYASPYMEKYVLEALFLLGHGDYALERMQNKYATMVNDERHTTLFEAWMEGSYGGGSTNHAWSGGPLTVIAQYLCGISPIEPGYDYFRIAPNPIGLKRASITVPSVKGRIESAYKLTDKSFLLDITIPKNTVSEVVLPTWLKMDKVTINGRPSAQTTFELKSGTYHIRMNK